jgi:uncharacterized membrane protein
MNLAHLVVVEDSAMKMIELQSSLLDARAPTESRVTEMRTVKPLRPSGDEARLQSVDTVRGIVMVIMALDHTRHFFSNSEYLFDPTDLLRTTPLLFFTRWITHFCAPVFVFLAGTGAYLSLSRGKSLPSLSSFLASRGLWLVFLEIFVISPVGWSFNFSFTITQLQVIWVIGISMIVLSALILVLPSRIIGTLGAAMIFLHNLFDSAHSAWLGGAADIWRVAHQTTLFEPWPHHFIRSFYPLVPWIGVMMAGYATGELMTLSVVWRRRAILVLGAFFITLFIVLRTWNVYGDPSPWSPQKNLLFSLMSFLRCNKYPPSLLYLLMTLGPALVFIALLDGKTNWFLEHFRIFGRVPLFYYLLHLPLLHGIAILFSYARFGNTSGVCQGVVTLQGAPQPPSSGCGYNLAVVYAVWIAAVLLLYPVCRWFAALKRRRREAIFSYL